MRKLSFIVCTLVASAALADNPQPQGGAPVKAPPPKAAGGEMMAPPKPAPELKQLEVFTGTFKCDMHAEAMMGMPARDVKGTWTGAWALDNFWLVGSYSQQDMKSNAWWGYDPATKMFTSTGFDSFGGIGHGTSKGWEGDNLVWNETATMMGQTMEFRTTFTKDKAGKPSIYKSEIKDKDGSFKPMMSGKCTKA
jgi:hypothetical protein